MSQQNDTEDSHTMGLSKYQGKNGIGGYHAKRCVSYQRRPNMCNIESAS